MGGTSCQQPMCMFVLLLLCSGCLPSGEDSWAHYSGGGHYPARSPSISPDGSTIVFSSPRSGHGDIYQIDTDGTNRVRLTDDPSFETDPVYSPDGTTIAFSRESKGCRHIWLMDRDGKNVRQLTSGKFLDDVVSFTADGSELIMYRSPLSYGMGRSIDYYAVRLDTKKLREIEGEVYYSDDGKTAVCSFANPQSGQYEIWTLDGDGSRKDLVAAGILGDLSPDGRTVLFTADASFSSPGSLWETIDIDGNNRRPIGQWSDPIFTSDGAHIVGLSPEWRRTVWRIDRDGSNRQRLPVPPGYVPGLYRCTKGVIFTLETGDRVGDIYLIDTEAWEVRKVAAIK